MNQNGLLGITLYHGTSSIFHDSIVEHGLGGIDILLQYKVKELLEVLCSVFENDYPNNDWWVMSGFICEKMLNNQVANSGMNFRYGSIYLSPSLFTARKYASLNKYGSEYLSIFMQGFEELKKLDINTATQLLSADSPVLKLLDKNSEPLVLAIDGIDKSWLSTEAGNDIEGQLQTLNETPEILWQQFNFETSEVIPYENITVIDENSM